MDVKPAQIQHLHCVYGKARNSLKTSRGVRSIDVCVQRSWQMLTGESPVVVKVGQPLSQ